MSQQELLKKVVTLLDGNGIDYMVTGSVASSLQGEPRSSHDIDLIIAIRNSDVPLLMKAFTGPEYYLEETSIREAIAHKSMFNLIEAQTGDKVDFWILTNEPFDRSRFTRKRVEEVFGIKIKVSCSEDTILSKLLWAAKSGGSQKQFTDALRVFEVQYKNLDLSYLDQWADNLEIASAWQHLKTAAEIMD